MIDRLEIMQILLYRNNPSTLCRGIPLKHYLKERQTQGYKGDDDEAILAVLPLFMPCNEALYFL